MERLRDLKPGPILAVVVAGLLWLIAPEVYTGTFSDLGTFLLVAVMVAAVAAWVFVIRRFVPRREFRWGLIGVPVAVLAWVVLWPYLRPPTKVDEALPDVVAAPQAASSPAVAPVGEAPDPTVPAAIPTTSEAADEDAPAPPSDASTQQAPTTTTTTPTTTTTTTPTGPVELRRAGFQGLTGHRGSGDATVYRLEDDSILLRFEEVDIGSGPDLNVWLVPGADERGLEGGTYVAPLTAEQGNQNYTVPAGVDLTTGTWTVLVWCDTFSVEVANATLA